MNSTFTGWVLIDLLAPSPLGKITLEFTRYERSVRASRSYLFILGTICSVVVALTLIFYFRVLLQSTGDLLGANFFTSLLIALQIQVRLSSVYFREMT